MAVRNPLAVHLILLSIALLAAVVPAAAQIPSTDTYRVRPAEILACGGFAGDCRAFILSGTLGLAGLAPVDGGFPGVAVVAADLRVRAADGSGASFPFPAFGDLQLTELTDDLDTSELVLTGPQGSAQTATLRLTRTGPAAVMLEGTYDEGCCDRFVYHLGTVLLEGQQGAPDDALVLMDGLFRVQVDWTDFELGSGSGTPVKLDERSGLFWFFSASNPELVVKVLDGCLVNGSYWFFAAGLTNVGLEIRVAGPGGTPQGTTNVYTNPLRQQFQPILDTAAFPCAAP